VKDANPYLHPVELRTLIDSPMPTNVRGALVTSAASGTDRGLQVRWVLDTSPGRIPAGRILLSWATIGEDTVDVTAHLGLAGAQVLLAVWPSLHGDWCEIVRPTLAEVMELHSAFRLAAAVLERLAR
jgi:hypothetical protein